MAEESLRGRIFAILQSLKAYLANDEQKAALGKLLIQSNWTVNPQCVGQAPGKIAAMAGFSVPAETSIICVELGGVGKQHPLSAEKLSPVLSLQFVKDFNDAIDTCYALLKFGGLGHTAVIHARDEGVLVNTPAPHGSTGITTNVFPAMTLGCGAAAGNATSDNIGPLNLINIKRLAYEVRSAAETSQPETRPAAGSDLPPDRGAVVASVERYLAARGVSRPSPVSESVLPNAAAEVVDRFLARRSSGSPPGQPSSGFG